MNRFLRTMAVVAGLTVPAGAYAAPFATIDIFTFDLGQFSSAFVNTDGTFASSMFDNAAGVDGFELGELASRAGGSTHPNDLGDRISLGNDTTQQFLTLDYGANPFQVGSGDASKFVVYESSGRTSPDPEGRNFEISFNGGGFFGAPANSTVSIVDVDGAGGAASHNQVVFDLLTLGLTQGALVSTVTIRNLIGFPDDSDPDFTFAGRAGSIAAIPIPAALPLLGTGLGVVGLFGWLRRRRSIRAA